MKRTADPTLAARLQVLPGRHVLDNGAFQTSAMLDHILLQPDLSSSTRVQGQRRLLSRSLELENALQASRLRDASAIALAILLASTWPGGHPSVGSARLEMHPGSDYFAHVKAEGTSLQAPLSGWVAHCSVIIASPMAPRRRL